MNVFRDSINHNINELFVGHVLANLNRNVIRRVNQQQARKVLTLGKRMVLVLSFGHCFAEGDFPHQMELLCETIINCPLELVVVMLFGAVANAASAPQLLLRHI